MGTARHAQRARTGILVVEDDFDSREMMKLFLESEGYPVVSAAHGKEALHQLSGLSPCLIILDLMMPVMNGWEFRAAQTQDPALSKIPVVVVSADGNVKEKATKLGVAGYLQKPVQFDALLDLVKQHC
jgi:CheY-like chemotaxis protein